MMWETQKTILRIICVITILLLCMYLCLYLWSRYYHHRFFSTFFPSEKNVPHSQKIATTYFFNKSRYLNQWSPTWYIDSHYTNTTNHGKRVFQQERWIIACTLRNHGYEVIQHWKDKWLPIFNQCRDYRIIIVENDSMDATRTLLHNWAKNDSRIIVLCGDDPNQEPNMPACSLQLYTQPYLNFKTFEKDTSSTRISILAFYRNAYLKYIYQHFPNYDRLLVCDLDLITEQYTLGFYQSVAYLDRHSSLWAIGAYTLTPDGKPFDPFSCIQNGKSIYWWELSNKKKHDREMKTRFHQVIEKRKDLLYVQSSFHGAVMYRLSNLCQYQPFYQYLKNGYVCEHATLHAQFPTRSFCLNPLWIHRLYKNLY